MHDESIELQLARRKVEEFDAKSKEPDVISQHAEAMACRDCDDAISLGVDAFAWLEGAEHTLVEAARMGLTVRDDVPGAITFLCESWMKSAIVVLAAVRHFEGLGYEIARVKEFNDAYARAAAKCNRARMQQAIMDLEAGKVYESVTRGRE